MKKMKCLCTNDFSNPRSRLLISLKRIPEKNSKLNAQNVLEEINLKKIHFHVSICPYKNINLNYLEKAILKISKLKAPQFLEEIYLNISISRLLMSLQKYLSKQLKKLKEVFLKDPL